MKEAYEKIDRSTDAGGETAIIAKDGEGRQLVLDMGDIRRRCDAVYADLEKRGVVPGLELSAEQIAMIREKMEMRGFDTLVWMQGRDRLPRAKEFIEKTIVDKDHIPPEFFGRATAESIDDLKEERPAEAYLLLTKSGGAESWTVGKSPEEIMALLKRLGERGLTLREHLLTEELSIRAGRGGQKPESVRTIGEFLLDSVLPNGEFLAVNRGAANDLSITSAKPSVGHPSFGARGAIVIPFPDKTE
jgi:hypothetical protein